MPPICGVCGSPTLCLKGRVTERESLHSSRREAGALGLPPGEAGCRTELSRGRGRLPPSKEVEPRRESPPPLPTGGSRLASAGSGRLPPSRDVARAPPALPVPKPAAEEDTGLRTSVSPAPQEIATRCNRCSAAAVCGRESSDLRLPSSLSVTARRADGPLTGLLLVLSPSQVVLRRIPLLPPCCNAVAGSRGSVSLRHRARVSSLPISHRCQGSSSTAPQLLRRLLMPPLLRAVPTAAAALAPEPATPPHPPRLCPATSADRAVLCGDDVDLKRRSNEAGPPPGRRAPSSYASG